MALTNRRLAMRNRDIVVFRVGDPVMLWEEANTAHAPSAADPNVNAPGRIRKQWTTSWSGPHKITKVTRFPGSADFSYTVWHHERAVEIPEVRSNRLALHDPWSEDEPSTSQDQDPSRGYKIVGRPLIGDLAVYPGTAPHVFIIGKVVQYTNTGNAVLHYYTNGAQHHRGSFYPAYYVPALGVQRSMVFGPNDPGPQYQRVTHKAPIQGYIAHGFTLTDERQHVRAPILRVISASPRSWWKLPSSTLGE
jgi:hypothetical protein